MDRHLIIYFVRIMVFVVTLCTPVGAASNVSWVVQFDRSRGQLPESIAIDRQGNIFVSFAPTGEVRKIAPDGTQSTLAVLGTGPVPRRLLGVGVDEGGNVYALLNDVPATRGVWRISRDGIATLFAPIPFAAALNALAFGSDGNLYVSDSLSATIYRITEDGSVSVWLTHPLLQGSATACGGFPFGPLGPNGLAFNNKGDLFVLITSQG